MTYGVAYEVGSAFLYPAIILMIVGSAELGNWLGLRNHRMRANSGDIGTLTGAALGLLALLLAFCFSIAREALVGRAQ